MVTPAYTVVNFKRGWPIKYIRSEFSIYVNSLYEHPIHWAHGGVQVQSKHHFASNILEIQNKVLLLRCFTFKLHKNILILLTVLR